MKSIFASALLALLASAPTLVSSIVPPGASTPEFYLVASSSGSSANLLPLRADGTLTGTQPIGQYYFYQGTLTAAPISSSDPFTTRALINSVLGASGCSTYGSLGFTVSSSSNKCAMFSTFGIQSDTENSQLGAQLVFNYVGGFYACGSNQAVWYKVSSNDGPSDCSPIFLYTVPVV